MLTRRQTLISNETRGRSFVLRLLCTNVQLWTCRAHCAGQLQLHEESVNIADRQAAGTAEIVNVAWLRAQRAQQYLRARYAGEGRERLLRRVLLAPDLQPQIGEDIIDARYEPRAVLDQCIAARAHRTEHAP